MSIKVLHLSTYDIEGGAARGTYWLHHALRKQGVDSSMLVMHRKSDDPTVLGPVTPNEKFVYVLREGFEQLPLYLYPKRDPYIFSPAWFPTLIHRRIREINPDIVHLHWVCGGFITPEVFRKFNRPIVWTLRDMWSFTGGCHLTRDCTKYMDACGGCPNLNSDKENDLSRKVWKRKFKAWKNLKLSIVGISHWLADCASRSSLFKNQNIHMIHNALDETIFKPREKNNIREILGLPLNKKLILFGAMKPTVDKNKGFEFLLSSLRHLAKQGLDKNREVVIIGTSPPKQPPDFGMKVNYLGKLNDDVALSLVYGSADVTVVPSIQESFGKTAIESMACGTPVVSFDSTGLKDIVEHQKSGYRANCFDPLDLAAGIGWVIEDESRWKSLSMRSRKKVEEEFTLKNQAEAYIDLYQQILQGKGD